MTHPMPTATTLRCDFEALPGQRHVVHCRRCGQSRQTRQDDPARIHRVCHGPAAREEASGLPQQAVQLAKDLGRFIASGAQRVSQEEYDARLGICAACDKLDRQSKRCRQCGCYLPIKAWGRVWHCPLAKWPPQAPASSDEGSGNDGE